MSTNNSKQSTYYLLLIPIWNIIASRCLAMSGKIDNTNAEV